MPRTILPDRAVIRVAGTDAEELLQNVLTCDVASARPLAYGALLTPQGKILADFLLHREGEGFALDMHEALADDVSKRLSLYRLRSKVEISRDPRRVEVRWGAQGEPEKGAADPRVEALGCRNLVEAETADDAGWNAHRIAHAVPECGLDYLPSTVFPHEAGMDSLGAIDFEKGCYVGQEVVSRTQHRGTARKRVLAVTGEGDLPPPGAELRAGERPLGTMGSAAGGHGIAFARLDRVREALDAGMPIRAGAHEVSLALPSWAGYSWPASDQEKDEWRAHRA